MGNEQLLFRLELITGGEFSEAVQGLPLILHRVGVVAPERSDRIIPVDVRQ